MSNMTLKELKRRILDALQEYPLGDGEVCFCDGNREQLAQILPRVISSSLVRMYDSLPIGEKSTKLLPTRPTAVFNSAFIDKCGVRAELDSGDLWAVFEGFGKGNVVFEDKDGNECVRIDCDGAESEYREKVTLDALGEYMIKTSGNVKAVNFVLYKNDNVTEKEALPPAGYISAHLPQDFDRIINGVPKNSFRISDSAEYMYVNDSFGINPVFEIIYKSKPAEILDDTDDGIELDLPPLAFDALASLCASELCRKGDSDLYTRLYYKYNDLCEGLRRSALGKRNNVFFSRSRKAGW